MLSPVSLSNQHLALLLHETFGVLMSVNSLSICRIRAIRLAPMARRFTKNRSGLSRLSRLSVFVLTFCYIADCGAEVSRESVQKAAFKSVNSAIAVVYSDIGEPYRSIFLQIIAGIEEQAKSRINAYPVGNNADTEALKSNLRQQDAKVVIALGRQGMKAALNLNVGTGLVVGGVIASPENEARGFPVNSLAPDPGLLFSSVREMMPAVRRIFAVYDPNQNGWLITLAKQAARNQGLELVAQQAPDLRTAVGFYRDIFNAADNRHDALWLPQDSTTVEDGSVLPLVLQESWDRSIPVFSSNAGHVRRGVLFSLYPDNGLLGRRLATVAINFLASGDYGERGVMLLRDVAMAVNLRTAQHLELDLGGRRFGMVFPEQ